MILLIWNLKKKRYKWEEGKIRRTGLTYTYYYIIKDVLLYSTGNYTQYFVIMHKGKEPEKECTHTYIVITHLIITKSLLYI